jgi:hypothetical protein
MQRLEVIDRGNPVCLGLKDMTPSYLNCCPARRATVERISNDGMRNVLWLVARRSRRTEEVWV